MKQKTITCIGGTGAAVIGTAFKNNDRWSVNLLVSLVDDGGSTGRLRKEFDIPPVGDIRKALASLSTMPESFINAFEHRFETGELAGHTMGNIFLAALILKYKNINKAIAEAEAMLMVRGHVLTTTLSATTLRTEFSNGSTIQGEHRLDENRDTTVGSPVAYKLIENEPANPLATTLLMKSDYIFIGPGDLGANTVAPLLTEGIQEAVKKTSAKLVYIANLMTKSGETHDMSINDCMRFIEAVIGRPFDYVMVNNATIDPHILSHYEKHNEHPMPCDIGDLEKSGARVIKGDLINTSLYSVSEADVCRRSILRHDGKKVMALLETIA